MLSVARSLFAWVAAFGFTVVLIRHWLPPLEVPTTVREKLAHIEQHADEYDALFLGSSRIQNHVQAALFDRIATEQGIAVKSFNAGVSSMRPPEDAYFFDQILAAKPGRLRWVFVEVDFLQTVFQEEQKNTLRGVYWHDWPRFSLLFRRCLVPRQHVNFIGKIQDASTRFGDLMDHATASVERCANVGRGYTMIDRAMNRWVPDKMDWRKLGDAGDGWTPAREKENPTPASRARLASILAERASGGPAKQSGDAVSRAALRELIDKITAAGATPILVIPPRTRESYFRPSHEDFPNVTVFDFCDPEKYPDLYKIDLRIDTSHLTAAGAEVFTRLLARRFAEMARKP
jgi:hypothetical protein